MSNVFVGKGNLGTAPTLKRVSVNGEDRAVCELRVFLTNTAAMLRARYSRAAASG
ncbi:MAG: hypothetical protein IPG66_08825 [Hydrogenophilales bacterium]|nr:hypothetical protein [Hydrogenophilales bacterium]